MLAHREPKKSPVVAPSTPAATNTEEYSIPLRDDEFPLPSQQSQPSQPDASMSDVQERADAAPEAGPSFVNIDESVPSFEDKFKVKEEYFDEEGYMHQWAKKHFVGVPPSHPHKWSEDGIVIRNNYSFSPRQVMNDGLGHMGITFQEFEHRYNS